MVEGSSSHKRLNYKLKYHTRSHEIMLYVGLITAVSHCYLCDVALCIYLYVLFLLLFIYLQFVEFVDIVYYVDLATSFRFVWFVFSVCVSLWAEQLLASCCSSVCQSDCTTLNHLSLWVPGPTHTHTQDCTGSIWETWIIELGQKSESSKTWGWIRNFDFVSEMFFRIFCIITSLEVVWYTIYLLWHHFV